MLSRAHIMKSKWDDRKKERGSLKTFLPKYKMGAEAFKANKGNMHCFETATKIPQETAGLAWEG